MQRKYQSQEIASLKDQQVRFAPRDKKSEQIEAAELLINELQPQKPYPFEFVCDRITGYRPKVPTRGLLSGKILLHDLRQFIEDLSASLEVTVEEVAEPVYQVEQLAKQFNVSTKTINRWREQGLVSRKFIFNGRKRVGFLKSSVDRFVLKNQQKVKRGGRFSQLSEEQRHEIIEHARHLANTGKRQSDVTRTLGKRLARSTETIRSTIRQFDKANPSLAIFPGISAPLNSHQKILLYKRHREGASLEKLKQEFGRNKTTIYRIVNEVRAEQIMQLPLELIMNPRFQRRGAEKACLDKFPENKTAGRKARRPAGLPAYLSSLYEQPLLTREQEEHLFRKYNYLKYMANKLREQLKKTNPKAALMDQIEAYYEQAVHTKNQITRANLRLVVSIAKRHLATDRNFFELVSDGNVSLLRAIEKFDFARGNKFSTYATWAIMKNFARTIPGEFKHQDRFRTSHEELFAATQEHRGDPLVEETAQHEREAQIEKILQRLDEREQIIIINRFGLDPTQEPKTLREIGENLGVTKERIRQIELRALVKLRQAMRDDKKPTE